MNTKGQNTTEFIGKSCLQVLSIVGLLGGMLDARTVAYLTFGIEVVYSIIRTIQKAQYGSTDLPEKQIDQPK